MIDIQVTLALLLILFTLRTTSEPLASATDLPRNTPVIYTAIVNVTYKDPLTGEQKYEYNDGWFSSENRIGPSWGWLQLARSADNRTDGCEPILNRVEGWWVALIERGRCRFHQKIENAAVFNNASAVIIYNNEHDAQVLNMQHSVEDVVAIFLRRNDGLRLVKLMENSTRVFVTITPGSTYFPSMDAPSRTSIIFLFISFIVLAVVSLLWLIFYYVQRFRLHSSFSAERARKNKIVKQLNQAAKLVVSKMEQKILKPEDPELSSAELQICAVCVEEYKVNDKIRILPCRHSFHKKCVDQWLHEKRRCPICQLDILKTAGIQIPEEYQNLNHDPPQAQAANDNNNNDDAGSSNDMSPVDADFDRDTVLVSIVPGCSTHLYLTSVSFVNENAQAVAAAAATGDCAAGRRSDREDASETTYHSNDSLLVLEALEGGQRSAEDEKVKVQEFKPRPSSDTLSIPSAMSSSSSSSTFDADGGRNSTKHQNNKNNNSNNDDVVVVVNGNHNNNNRSMTSVNSRLTAVACRGRDDNDDDDDDDDEGGGDDDSLSSSFSPSRYYDCHFEDHKHQTN